MIRLFSMFTGYGGAEFGLRKAGIPFETVGYSEIDKAAIKIYETNFPGTNNFGDCTRINPDDLPSFDLLTGGFPCQDVSVAGRRDLTKGRTNLYTEILRIAQAKKPKYLLLENVKGLLSAEKDERICDPLFLKVVRDLKRLGYGVCYKVLNSKDFGVPQNRERIWFVCKLGGWSFGEFFFPEPTGLKLKINDVLEKDIDQKYFLKPHQVQHILKVLEKGNKHSDVKTHDHSFTLTRRDYKDPKVIFALRTRQEMKGEWRKDREGKFANCEFNTDGVSNTLTSVQKDNIVALPKFLDLYNGKAQDICPIITLPHHNNLRLYEPKPIPCITEAIGRQGSSQEFINSCETIYEQIGVFRRLTPKECFRLMGFLNDEINFASLSDTALYKLAGNGWEINVVSKIFKKMFRGG